MQVMFNAQERTLREIMALTRSAGWRVIKVTRRQGSCFGHIVAVPCDFDVDATGERGGLEEEVGKVVEVVVSSPKAEGGGGCLVGEPEAVAVLVSAGFGPAPRRSGSSVSLKEEFVAARGGGDAPSMSSIDLPSVAGNSTRGGTNINPNSNLNLNDHENSNSNSHSMPDRKVDTALWGSYWKEDTTLPSLELCTQLPSNRDGRKNPIFGGGGNGHGNESEVEIKLVTEKGVPTGKTRKGRRGACFVFRYFSPHIYFYLCVSCVV